MIAVIRKMINFIQVFSFIMLILVGVCDFISQIVGPGRMEDILDSVGIKDSYNRISIIGMISAILLFATILVKEKYFEN